MAASHTTGLGSTGEALASPPVRDRTTGVADSSNERTAATAAARSGPRSRHRAGTAASRRAHTIGALAAGVRAPAGIAALGREALPASFALSLHDDRARASRVVICFTALIAANEIKQPLAL